MGKLNCCVGVIVEDEADAEELLCGGVFDALDVDALLASCGFWG